MLVRVFSLFLTMLVFAIYTKSFPLTDQPKKYTILFIFPHPDDESYGPAAVIDKYVKEGHKVHLLTLTKGGATRMRHELGLNMEQMGEVRYQEMQDMKKVLGFSSMTVFDLPDGGLPETDPREIEKIIKDQIQKIKPEILVTYPVHGISAHNDHIVTHAAVKRVFIELTEKKSSLKRLAFFHLTEDDDEVVPTVDYKTIRESELDCVVKFSPENRAAAHKALDSYTTYQPIIDGSNIKAAFVNSLSFDFFRESFNPPVGSLTDRIDDNN